jgi:hypothetical protein
MSNGVLMVWNTVARAVARTLLAPAEDVSVAERRAAALAHRTVFLGLAAISLTIAILALGSAVLAHHGKPTNLPSPKAVATIGGEPRALALDGGSVLVAGTEGHITELGGINLSVIHRTDLHRRLEGIAAFSGIVYVVSQDGRLTWFAREDPKHRQVARIAKNNVNLKVAAGPRGVFVAEADDGEIVQRDPQHVTTLSRVALHGHIGDLLATADGIWATMPGRGEVAFVPYGDKRASHGRPRFVAGYGVPRSLDAGGGLVWVSSTQPSTLWAINEKTKRVEAANSIPIPIPSAVAVSNGSAWIASRQRDVITQIGTNSRQRIDRFPVGTGSQPIDLIADPSALWSANAGDGSVTRLDLQIAGALHSLPAPAAEPPRLKGVSRSVWFGLFGLFLGTAFVLLTMRWWEGSVLRELYVRLPARLRPIFCNPYELKLLATRQPDSETVNEVRENTRTWGMIWRWISGLFSRRKVTTTERSFGTEDTVGLLRDTIEDKTIRRQLGHDLHRLPHPDETGRRRGHRPSDDVIVAAVRDRFDRLSDTPVLLEEVSLTLHPADDERFIVARLEYVLGRDRKTRIPVSPAGQLTMTVARAHFTEGRGERLLAAGEALACDVLAVVERRPETDSPLVLTAVAFYTPISDEVQVPPPSIRRRRRSAKTATEWSGRRGQMRRRAGSAPSRGS